MPQTLVLPAAGVPVAASGPLMRAMTFHGSYASCKSHRPGATAKSQNMAAPIPKPPPNSSYLAVSMVLIVLLVRFILRVLPTYPPVIFALLALLLLDCRFGPGVFMAPGAAEPN